MDGAWHEDPAFWTRFGPGLAQPEDPDQDVRGFMELSRLPSQARVLDVGCGLGRHSLALARHGLKVTALDISPHRLRHVTSVARDEELEVEILCRDVRLFRRPRHFHAILWTGDSVGLFLDDATERSVIQGLYDALKPGGRLVMVARGKELVARGLQHQSHQRLDASTFVLADRVIDDGFTSLQVRLTRVSHEGIDEVDCAWKLFSGSELTASLTAAGFKKVRIYGDLGRVRYDHHARRLVAVAER